MKYIIGLLVSLFLVTAIQAKELAVKDSDVFYFQGTVDFSMASAFSRFLDKAKTKNKSEVTILINSPGGLVLSGSAMIDAMRASKLKTVCIVQSMAASMAAIFLEHCTIRYSISSSLFLFHYASGGLEGSLPQMASRLNAISNLVDFIDKEVIKRLKLTPEEYYKRCANEWWISTGEEAKKQGVIDDVIDLNIIYTEYPNYSIPTFEEQRRQNNPYDYNTENFDQLDGVNQVINFTH